MGWSVAVSKTRVKTKSVARKIRKVLMDQVATDCAEGK